MPGFILSNTVSILLSTCLNFNKVMTAVSSPNCCFFFLQIWFLFFEGRDRFVATEVSQGCAASSLPLPIPPATSAVSAQREIIVFHLPFNLIWDLRFKREVCFEGNIGESLAVKGPCRDQVKTKLISRCLKQEETFIEGGY